MPCRTYRLTVEGELDDHLRVAFDGMTLTRADGNTLLTGRVRDQAELQGYLQRVSDFGLTLLEAKAIDGSTPEDGGDLGGRRWQRRKHHPPGPASTYPSRTGRLWGST